MTSIRMDVSRALRDFMIDGAPGVYVSVDGQFGSTGKGVINGIMGELFRRRFDMVVSNAGPNSGHTNIMEWPDGNEEIEKVILKQLPTFAVAARKIAARSKTPTVYPHIHLSGGAVIDPEILKKEIRDHDFPRSKVTVHPAAAVINDDSKEIDKGNVRSIASTGMGVGPAIQHKLLRVPSAVAGGSPLMEDVGCFIDTRHPAKNDDVYMEVSQGFSLGINSGFYPHTTTRECTVSQALADAGFPPQLLRRTIMSLRTFPIRVGSTKNTSGPCYPDQEEISWEQLGQVPELTTVTKRVRRVFTWSRIQYLQALWANMPSVLFVNFVNYLPPGEVDSWIRTNILLPYLDLFNMPPLAILKGYGPKPSDVHAFDLPRV